ncbi:MAG: VWA domain-containing protein [Bacteroidales bacterium]|nr:VWA domain-containing protein [Bacteroidales bacterium]MCF8392100.1 VWA domain-containing protein [Bacteroidales bacterium]
MLNYNFANPGLLYLLLVLPLMVVFYILRQSKDTPDIKLSSVSLFSGGAIPFRLILKHVMFALKILGLAFLILAIARPQSTDSWSETSTEGIDITLCLDVSGSMRAMDLKPDRLEAAKNVAAEFINGRQNDRIAIVAFSGESFTVCPLTSDRAVAVNQLNELNFGMIEDGTAIGMGVATSVNRLKDSDAVSKVIILLTDGVNNSGTIGPLTAADIANEFGIRIYTIGVGTQGTAPIQVQTPFGTRTQQMPVEIDEDVLKEISEKTGGMYFRATDNQSLKEIYVQIDKLEKTILDTQDYSKKHEEYFLFLLIGLVLILFDKVLSLTIVKSLN